MTRAAEPLTPYFLELRHYTIVSEDLAPSGKTVLSFAFDKTGSYQGEGRLFIDGK
jgi:hypothetical protein